ncbi:hypothetical protein PV10_02819 [Exophiala mesophila]|uniref:Uncharacterized protein n=1 Tax=Exophiala mesophila TaxID=212818 RepID=A0A0D1ZME8_EXOME|nr:uncharacterized protein PV10_02819 [Exophiala mesophila]KIV95134.1 hypothetical protein PV10_02819 [Exophiala mesophila]
MEDFSQSRGDDDLFDDEIIPFEAPPSPKPAVAQPTSQSQPQPSQPPPPRESIPATSAPTSRPVNESSLPGFRNKNNHGGRDAPPQSGRGGATSKTRGLMDSRWATNSTKSTQQQSTPSSKEKEVPPQPPTEPQQPVVGEEETTTTPSAGQNPPTTTTTTTEPSTQDPAQKPRPPAVRGDRTATGGVRKPKLTEEQLTARLAEAKERSESRAAAHARAQADAASFQERERLAEEKRAHERAERKVMDNEREKHRQRKMAVMGGREWDAGKNEEDFRESGRGGGRRGFKDGFTPQQQFDSERDDLRQYEWNDDRGRGQGRGRGRGRGGRGVGGGGGRGGGGRGGGRGGFGQDDTPFQNRPDVSADTEFPALPGSGSGSSQPRVAKETPATATKDTPNPRRWATDGLQSPGEGGGGGSWAEQVESSEAAASVQS